MSNDNAFQNVNETTETESNIFSYQSLKEIKSRCLHVILLMPMLRSDQKYLPLINVKTKRQSCLINKFKEPLSYPELKQLVNLHFGDLKDSCP